MHALCVSDGVSVSSQEGAAGSRWCPSPREDWNTAPGACFPLLTGAAPLPSRSAGAKQRQTHTNCQPLFMTLPHIPGERPTRGMFKALHNVNSTCYTYGSYQTYPCLYVRTYIHTSFSCKSTLHSQDASLYDCNMCSGKTGSISVAHTGILQLWASTRHIPQHRKSQPPHTMTTSGWSSAQTACSRMQTVGVVHSSIRTS